MRITKTFVLPIVFALSFELAKVYMDDEADRRACGGRYTGPYGTITSPNYPNRYGSHQKCRYVITVDTGKFIRLQFDVYEPDYPTNCVNDRLIIIINRLRHSVCGITQNSIMQIDANTVTLIYKTRKSFSITYTAVSDRRNANGKSSGNGTDNGTGNVNGNADDNGNGNGNGDG